MSANFVSSLGNGTCCICARGLLPLRARALRGRSVEYIDRLLVFAEPFYRFALERDGM